MASNSKSEEETEDRISQMPNDVLCNILSFLNTHEAVHTTILSKRWNNCWTSLLNLEFNDKYFPASWQDLESDPFMTFVDRVLSLRAPNDIRKFSLSRIHRDVEIAAEDIDLIHSWMSAAIEHNVVEVDLSLVECNGLTFELPHSLFLCQTLVALKVESNCISFDLPTTGCFPSLKVLVVSFTNPDSTNPIWNLFSCCPVLEELAMYGCFGDNGLDIKISAPELKTLKICFSWNEYYFGDPAYNFLIYAPKMENFSLNDPWFLSSYHLENGESIVKAKIALGNGDEYDSICFADRTTALLGRIPNVKYLSFSATYLENLHLSTNFDVLYQLELAVRGCNYWQLLTELLKRSPNLRHFVLQNSGCKPYFEEELERKLLGPQSVPNCLLSSLETITIKQFTGGRDEMEVAEYLLNNCEVLNTMKIYIMQPRSTRGELTKEEFYEKFSLYEKGSKSCQVEFIYDENWTEYTDVILFDDIWSYDVLFPKYSNTRLVKVVKE